MFKYIPLKELVVIINMHSFFSKGRSHIINSAAELLRFICNCDLQMSEFKIIILTGSNILVCVKSLTKDKKLSLWTSNLFASLTSVFSLLSILTIK